MKIKRVFYERLCDPLFLEDAWIDACEHAAAAGFTRCALLHYEQFLASNLADLARRLRNNSYSPATQAGEGDTLSAELNRFEGLIVQQALHNLLARHFGLTAGGCADRQADAADAAELAVAQVLAQREQGANIFIGAEIACQPSVFSRELLLRLAAPRLTDRRLQRLLGQALNFDGSSPGVVRESLLLDYAGALLPDEENVLALTKWVEACRNDNRFAGARSLAFNQRGGQMVKARPFLKSALKQFGRDMALTALGSSALAWSSGTQPRQLFTRKSLATTGAILLAKAALPAAAQAVLGKYVAPGKRAGEWPDNPLVALLADLALQDFDSVMARAGLPLARCQNQLALATRSGSAARPALQLAAQELRRFGMLLQPGKTFARRFDQGVTFFGYRFHEGLIAAEPLPLAAFAH
jgi:hypothetical protein